MVKNVNKQLDNKNMNLAVASSLLPCNLLYILNACRATVKEILSVLKLVT